LPPILASTTLVPAQDRAAVEAKELETAEAMAVTEPMTSAADIKTSVRRRRLPWLLD
jgi:hypothetical protein